MTSRSLTDAECCLLLQSRRLGRVVFTDRALPSALPVNYLVTDHAVVFRTDPTGVLAATLGAVDDAVLGFEVDDLDESLHAGWSVLVVGLARRLNGVEAREIDEAGLRSWGSETASTFIRIPMDRVTGRAVEPSLPDTD